MFSVETTHSELNQNHVYIFPLVSLILKGTALSGSVVVHRTVLELHPFLICSVRI